MSEFLELQVGLDNFIKNTVLKEFPQLGTNTLFRNPFPQKPKELNTINVNRGVGNSERSIFTIGASRWGSKYRVVAD